MTLAFSWGSSIHADQECQRFPVLNGKLRKLALTLLGKHTCIERHLGKSFGWVHSMTCPNLHNMQCREEEEEMGLPALNLLARLRKPLPLSPRHWSLGHKTRLGIKSRGCHKRASQELKAPPQTGRQKPKVLPPEGKRKCSVMSQGAPNKAHASPVGPCKSHCTKRSCPLGRDQAWDLEGGPTGKQILNLKDLLGPWTSQ